MSRKTNLSSVVTSFICAAGIVLVYPQLTALKALQKNPPSPDSSPAIREAAQAAIASARASRSPLVSQAAEKITGH